MFKQMDIQSCSGSYSVIFEDDAFRRLNANVPAKSHFIIDQKVAGLYSEELDNVLTSSSVLQIEATEHNKALEKFAGYVEYLVSRGVRRDHMLVAIGGGIIQDIACFLSATLLRGLSWHFYPTTLLAQADSCIGSKSSINVGRMKNILGTFTPPEKIFVATRVLSTLEEREIRSGIGEMLKVHGIDGPESFDQIAADYYRISKDPAAMEQYIFRSLEIKKALIEMDEFDRGPRNVMNYGHSFGHAIESATDFAIPHGIAVSIGMDMANYVAVRLGITDEVHYLRMRPSLVANSRGYEHTSIPIEAFLSAITKDKKNTDAKLRLILPDALGRVGIGLYKNDANFREICSDYFRKNFRP